MLLTSPHLDFAKFAIAQLIRHSLDRSLHNLPFYPGSVSDRVTRTPVAYFEQTFYFVESNLTPPCAMI